MGLSLVASDAGAGGLGPPSTPYSAAWVSPCQGLPGATGGRQAPPELLCCFVREPQRLFVCCLPAGFLGAESRAWRCWCREGGKKRPWQEAGAGEKLPHGEIGSEQHKDPVEE